MISNKRSISIITALLILALVVGMQIPMNNVVNAEGADETFNVTFDPNGGTTSFYEKKITSGSAIEGLPTATKKKHVFLGWFTEKTGGEKISSETIINKDAKFYAQWKRQYLVVINAGHQQKVNLKKEPIGPGSKKKKIKNAAGTRGVYTKVREATRTLQIAKRLKKDLEAKGIKVYMIRTKANVMISNATRAKKANSLDADLMMNIHCDASSKRSVKGMTMLVPKKNKWTKDCYSKSLKAGKIVQKELIKNTKAKNRGISKRGDLTTFNYSDVPTILIETGFMTNKSEDKKLAKASYQNKISKGLANGIEKYLKTQK